MSFDSTAARPFPIYPTLSTSGKNLDTETILLLAGHSVNTSIPALGKQRQKDLEYQASLGCTVILRPLKGKQDSISQQQNKPKKPKQ